MVSTIRPPAIPKVLMTASLRNKHSKGFYLILACAIFVFWFSVHESYSSLKRLKSPTDSLVIHTAELPSRFEKFVEPRDIFALSDDDIAKYYIAHNSKISDGSDIKSPNEDRRIFTEGQEERTRNLQKMMAKLIPLIAENKPAIRALSTIQATEDITPAQDLQASNLVLTKDILSSNLIVDQDYIAALKSSFRNFTTEFNSIFQTVDKKFFYRGKSAVTMYDSDSVLFASVNSELLDELRTTYPLQLLSTDTHLKKYSVCNPSTTTMAKECISLSNFTSHQDMQDLNPTGSRYLYNLFALLVTNTAEKAFFSSNSAMLINPILLKLEPDTNLMLWPNSKTNSVEKTLKRVIHPAFYEVFDISIGGRVRVDEDDIMDPVIATGFNNAADEIPFHDLENTISEQYITSDVLAINVAHHFETIVTAIYLGVYAEWYLPLVMQSSSDNAREIYEADLLKIASSIMKKPYHKIRSPAQLVNPTDYGVSLSQDQIAESEAIASHKQYLTQLSNPKAYDNSKYAKAFEALREKKTRINYFAVNLPQALNPLTHDPKTLFRDPVTEMRRAVLDYNRLVTLKPTFDYELVYYDKLFMANTCGWKIESRRDTPKTNKNELSKRDCLELREHIKFLKNNPRDSRTF